MVVGLSYSRVQMSGRGPTYVVSSAVRGAGRGIHRRIQSPARTLIDWLIGSRIPGGLGVYRGGVTPGYASCCALARPGATGSRPPAADFPTMSQVGLDCGRSVVFNARLSLMQPFCKIPSVVRLRRYPRLRFVLRTR